MQDEHCVMLVSGIVLAQYSLTDQMVEAFDVRSCGVSELETPTIAQGKTCQS